MNLTKEFFRARKSCALCAHSRGSERRKHRHEKMAQAGAASAQLPLWLAVAHESDDDGVTELLDGTARAQSVDGAGNQDAALALRFQH